MVNISEAEAPLCYTNAFTAERGYSSGIWFTAMQAVRRQEGMARGSSNEGDATVSYLTIGFNQQSNASPKAGTKRVAKGVRIRSADICQLLPLPGRDGEWQSKIGYDIRDAQELGSSKM